MFCVVFLTPSPRVFAVLSIVSSVPTIPPHNGVLFRKVEQEFSCGRRHETQRAEFSMYFANHMRDSNNNNNNKTTITTTPITLTKITTTRKQKQNPLRECCRILHDSHVPRHHHSEVQDACWVCSYFCCSPNADMNDSTDTSSPACVHTGAHLPVQSNPILLFTAPPTTEAISGLSSVKL